MTKCAQLPTGQGGFIPTFDCPSHQKKTMNSGQTLSLTFSGTSRKYCGYSYITPTLLTKIKYNKHPKFFTIKEQWKVTVKGPGDTTPSSHQ